MYPSAGEVAAIAEPIDPVAPGRFSTIKDCPICSVSFWAASLAKTSVGPPAAKGTMILTVREGYSCAFTGLARNKPRLTDHPNKIKVDTQVLLRIDSFRVSKVI